MELAEWLDQMGASVGSGVGGWLLLLLLHHWKLLLPLLVKLTNLVPGSGIWLNTQRPEWNDANNALAGWGLSLVTLNAVARYARFLRATFPDARKVEREIRIPRTYPPIELCLMRGSVYMTADDPLVDPELESELGAEDFAAIEVDNQHYILGFDVTSDHRDEILYSLGVVRHSINRKIRQNQVADIFREARAIQTSILPRAAPRFGAFDTLYLGGGTPSVLSDDALVELVARIGRGERPDDVPNFLSWRGGARPSAAEAPPDTPST